ncbi:hypothetical protein M948_18315 [Virgibacillus sp. CM-4]|uniref:Panacea domain-containing protein n=1 Tax=Virgibacillus sp. CM-4 TaxID=1354277 RepID=UPI0003886FB2|nr:type II toxin-antitoxin system antitoxin SocA domain-containing protein [Virgibacillus sp. CM-4]EQB35054.1 hypothetical protein M948_18315 [Virgibacillus sp. CM-4]
MKGVKFSFLSEGRKMSQNSIFDVAKFFLSKNDANMTHKKLQKLCYYAFSWNLALRNKFLFREQFQAWVHGPVAPVLYSKYKEHGWKTIPSEDAPSFDQDDQAMLEEVFRIYGSFTGDELETLTHSEEPWVYARGDLAPYEPSQVQLSDAIIKDYYLRVYERAQND